MDWTSVTFDWNQARSFLVTADEGTLSGAARALGLTQPTLGRQVAALEASLGVTLFERVGKSLVLTDAGNELLAHVRVMGEAAGKLSLSALGQSRNIEGKVRITATDATSAYRLPSILKLIRETAPGIEIEVVSSNSLRDLRRREADIAIRHVRPDEPNLVAKLVRETSAHLFASSGYLDHFGRPETVDDLADAVFVGFEEPDRMLPALAEIGLHLRRDQFRVTTNNGVAMYEMMKQGLGIGFMPKYDAVEILGLEQILPNLPAIPVPVWLTAHSEVHTSPRVRLVFDLLADAL
ncbi:LysR family transcriptional regulator [Parvibaculaceae bacterium PLY_AMNH_Bact1]|nr:LysR family transcriptional regulator [Parvibaculaceae bacterium PLY_AMNH_Bact1]